jgi:hypothetical protein
MSEYYTYAYLKEDGLPYYIGKGKGNRLYDYRGKNCNPPKDRSSIIKLKQNLTEEEAFRHEIYMIAVFGKKCDGTGILMNIADGGNAPPKMYGDDSPTKRQEVRAKISAALKGRKGNLVSLETRQKQSNTWKEKLKNNPRQMSYYAENLKKMAERNSTDKDKHKRHSEMMKGRSSPNQKPVIYDGNVYISMTETMKKTGLSRYLILKRGGKFINKSDIK